MLRLFIKNVRKCPQALSLCTHGYPWLLVDIRQYWILKMFLAEFREYPRASSKRIHGYPRILVDIADISCEGLQTLENSHRHSVCMDIRICECSWILRTRTVHIHGCLCILIDIHDYVFVHSGMSANVRKYAQASSVYICGYS